MSILISFYHECFSSASCQFCQVGMLWGPAFLFGTSNEVPSPHFLHPNFQDTSLFLIQLLCSSHDVPMILKVTIKTFCWTFLFYAYTVFLPGVEFCHWLFITQKINYLCTLKKLSLMHLFQLAKTSENQSRVLVALLVLHSFEVQPNYLKQ